ncbi:MAG: hypothetical protein ACK5Y8_03540 [Betaproteobacteria bacterium]|jgi:hypothetical protein|nr:hypothetical protein [Burkholderiaceae bacterium]MCZ8110196.1 hypothetical protein [Rubrivivax sp.]MCZ8176743.1 hypothetical protein [Burkholderiaceae bacterium]
MHTIAPRQFGPALAGLGKPDLSGLPHDRQARAAARRAFVDLKRTFMHALEGLHDVEWLLTQVRAAEEPVDLWLLRAPAFAALAGADPQVRHRRQRLRRGLDSVFPELDEPSGFVLL